MRIKTRETTNIYRMVLLFRGVDGHFRYYYYYRMASKWKQDVCVCVRATCVRRKYTNIITYNRSKINCRFICSE